MTAKRSATLVLVLFWAQEVAFSYVLYSFGYRGTAAFVAFVALAVLVGVAGTAIAETIGAPYVPIMSDRIGTMLSLSGLKAGETLYDLGSGDGRILIAAAQAGATAEGWEVNPYLWAYSLWRIRRAGMHGRVRVHLGSYWGASMRAADVVTLFLTTEHMPRMEAKLLAELKPGSRVVSFVFSLPEWQHETMRDNTFLYRKP